MKIRAALVATTLVLSCSLVHAQSSHDIETKYGKSDDVYSVNENLWMTPTYDVQGQVCMMRVYPKTVSRNVNHLGSSLDMDQTLKFINEVFPVPTRGRREDGFGMSDLGGGIVWTRFNYEHVRFVFISTFRLTKLPEKSESHVLLDFSPNEEAEFAEYKRREEMKSDDQLIRERTHDARILQIVWVNRKCAKP